MTKAMSVLSKIDHRSAAWTDPRLGDEAYTKGPFKRHEGADVRKKLCDDTKVDAV